MRSATIIALTRLGFASRLYVLDRPVVLEHELDVMVEGAAEQIIQLAHAGIRRKADCSIHDVRSLCIGGGNMTSGFEATLSRMGYNPDGEYDTNRMFWTSIGVSPEMYAVLIERSL